MLVCVQVYIIVINIKYKSDVPSNGGQQDGVTGLAGGLRGGRIRVPRSINGSPTNESFVEDEFFTVNFTSGLEDLQRDGHDLRADAVSRENCDFMGSIAHVEIFASRFDGRRTAECGEGAASRAAGCD